MKTIRLLSFMLVIAGFSFTACSQSNKKDSKFSSVTIKTSVKCDMCKERIEKALADEKGVKKVNVDLKAKTVAVSYNPTKTNPDNIRKAITKTGYTADDIPADKDAFDKLPPCCKKDGEDH